MRTGILLRSQNADLVYPLPGSPEIENDDESCLMGDMSKTKSGAVNKF